jgi:hypothetical protein
VYTPQQPDKTLNPNSQPVTASTHLQAAEPALAAHDQELLLLLLLVLRRRPRA